MSNRLSSPPALSPTPSVLRIVIVAAIAASRDTLRNDLAAEAEFTVTGAAGNVAEAVDVIQAHRPHVLLLDLTTPHVGGLEALRHLRDSGTGVPAVILTNAMVSPEVVPALLLGAHGVLPKGVLPSARYECMKTVARGEYWVGTEPARDVVEAWQQVRAVLWPVPAAVRHGLAAYSLQ